MSKAKVNSNRVQLFCNDVSLTHQEFADECNISNIMHKYRRSGILPQMSNINAIYGDFTDVPDYQASLNIVIQAQESFDSLPASVRKRFSNDPAQFLEFVHDESNREEAIKLGLIDIKSDSSVINPVIDSKVSTNSTETQPKVEPTSSST